MAVQRSGTVRALALSRTHYSARSIVSLDRRVALLAQGIIVPDGALGLASSLIARTESDDIAVITEGLLAIV